MDKTDNVACIAGVFFGGATWENAGSYSRVLDVFVYGNLSKTDADFNYFFCFQWVGGRYSLWSAIGMSIAVYIGDKNYFLFISQKCLVSLKLRKNGQQKTYNLFCNIAAKRVE